MSFRYEYKYFINPNRKLEFYNWLNENDFKKNYPDRIINSIYFDNNSLSMFLDSEEGLVPRKKIRIRWYGGLNNLILSDANFEEKTSSVEGRFKVSNKINKDFFLKKMKEGFLDNNYGLCKIKSLVTYSREYYLKKDTRITFDKNITFIKIINGKLSFRKKIEDNVCEFKFPFKKIGHEHTSNFPFDMTRFSKYCSSIKELY
tara:strand:+ start:325 stop:930 length:606 start_codon:yes stop_codon:yes gene_type:complete